MPFHIIAVFFDAYTYFLGTAQNFLLKDSRTAFITIGFGEVWERTTFEQRKLFFICNSISHNESYCILKIQTLKIIDTKLKK